MPWQYLSAAVVLPTPGLRGSTIQDTLQPQKADYVFVPDNADTIDQTSAYVCVTTFRPTCEIMTGTHVDSSSNTSEALAWSIDLSDGWTVNIDPSVATVNTLTNVISPAIRIVPAPVSVPLYTYWSEFSYIHSGRVMHRNRKLLT
jgi:hypothetical protein